MHLTNFHFYNTKNYLYSNPVKGLQSYGVGYGFAFNGHEKDDEIKGEGNYVSFGDYGYDSRIGRRLGTDPVIKHHMSAYSTFSNNPIIFIDPNGTTDYYNAKGRWIGTDGINNGLKQMALTKATAKIIKRATRHNQNISMNVKFYRDIIDVPSKGEITAMDNVYTKMEKSGKEEGFVVGNPAGGGEKKISEPPSTNIDRFDPQPAYEELKSQGASGSYDSHGHPSVLKYIGGDKYKIASPRSSEGDNTSTVGYEQDYGRTQANIVLGYNLPEGIEGISETDQSNAQSNQGNWVPLSGLYNRTITFYDNKGYVAGFDYDKFKKIIEKVNKNGDSKSKAKSCPPN